VYYWIKYNCWIKIWRRSNYFLRPDCGIFGIDGSMFSAAAAAAANSATLAESRKSTTLGWRKFRRSTSKFFAMLAEFLSSYQKYCQIGNVLPV